jgi:hypothetical protein
MLSALGAVRFGNGGSCDAQKDLKMRPECCLITLKENMSVGRANRRWESTVKNSDAEKW